MSSTPPCPGMRLQIHSLLRTLRLTWWCAHGRFVFVCVCCSSDRPQAGKLINNTYSFCNSGVWKFKLKALTDPHPVRDLVAAFEGEAPFSEMLSDGRRKNDMERPSSSLELLRKIPAGLPWGQVPVHPGLSS